MQIRSLAVVSCALMFGASSANATLVDTRTRVICAYAPSQHAAVNKISSAVAGAGAGAAVTLQAAGLTVVPHVGGAYILTGAGGYVAGTMAGATAAAVAIPVTVFVGGAALAVELICAPENHPNLVAKVLHNSKEYWSGSKERIEAFFRDIPESPTIKQTGDYWATKIQGFLSK